LIKIHFRSVRGRLFLLVAAIALPALLLAVLIITQAYRSERAYAYTQLLSTAHAFAGTVDAEVENADGMLKLIAATLESRGGKASGIELVLRHALVGDDRWFVLAAADGHEVFNTLRPFGEPLPHWRFDESVARAVRTGKVTVSDLGFRADGSRAAVHVLETWPAKGPLQYVLSVGLRPDALARAVDIGRYAANGFAVIIDRQGKILARSLKPELYVGKTIPPDFYRRITTQAEGVFETVSIEGTPVLSAYCRTNAGWTVVVATQRNRFYDASRRLLLGAVAVTAMLTLLAILMARWISRALLRSVDLLRADAAALGRGDMPPQKPSGLEETDFVADAMHRAADLLRQRTRDNALLNAELERKVEERTASLREAMTQMEEFSYTVSHDLRSPLRAMQGYAHLLVEDYGEKLDETGVNYLDRIGRAAERMDRMTSDLLTYSRLSSTRVELAPVNIESVVRHAVEQYIELPRKPAQVQIVAPLASVMAHEPSLTQAIANLLTNAVKFVKPGEPAMITLRTESIGTRVRIWVEDQGISIAPELQPALFRMFERLPTGGTYEGTGIGLAIVKKAAEKMGGTCGVESDGFSGSKFWIELAAAPDAPL